VSQRLVVLVKGGRDVR